MNTNQARLEALYDLATAEFRETHAVSLVTLVALEEAGANIKNITDELDARLAD